MKKFGLIAIILLFTVVANFLCLTVFDAALTTFIGASESTVDTGNLEGDLASLDTQYVKPSFSSFEEFRETEYKFSEEIAIEGITLLKNDNDVLPLNKSTEKISLWGYASYNTMACGTGSGGNIYSPNQATLYSGLTNAGFEINDNLWNFYSRSSYSFTSSSTGRSYQANKSTDYTYGKGGNGIGSRNYGNAWSDWTLFEIPFSTVAANTSVMNEAKGTVAIYTMTRYGGEGRDLPREMSPWVSGNSSDVATDSKKHYLQPYSREVEMLKELDKRYDKVIVLLNANNPMQLDEIDPYADAIIWLPGSGTAGLNGLGRLLSGAQNFSGHLPDTFATDSLNAPAMQNMGDFQYTGSGFQKKPYYYMSYKEGIYVGYKYYETRYEDMVLGQGNAAEADVYNTNGFNYSDQVVYPFGYGLSYTDFEWSDFSVTEKNDIFTVRVTVKNVGNRAGKDVVQIYYQAPYTPGGVEKASVNLVQFAKTKKLAAGESQTLEISFYKEDMKSYDYKNEQTYVLDEGTYYITAATDAHNAVNNILKAKGAKGLDGIGYANMVQHFELSRVLYNEGANGVSVKNRLQHAYDESLTVLSRSDWAKTYPTIDGTPSNIKSEDGERGAVIYTKPGSMSLAQKFNAELSGNPVQENPDKIRRPIVDGTGTSELQLIDLRGRAYDDPAWELLLDKVSLKEIQQTVLQSGFQTMYMENIGKPDTKECDGPTGVNGSNSNGTQRAEVVYSSSVMVGMTFNQTLAYRFGLLCGNAGLYFEREGWYAPGMNIHRTPFSGRNFEYYSEDAVLTGILGSQTIRGAASKGMYAFMKHFAINDQETHRGENASYGLVTWIDEQAAREIYLKPFEMAIKADPVSINYYEVDKDGNYIWSQAEVPACMAIMTSFNRIGTVWAGGDYNLLTGIVRREWGFNGFILTDFQSYSGYMDPKQMLYAGGDAELRALADVPYAYDPANSNADYYYGREAVHHILYAIANSAAMNGMVHGAVFTPGFAYYKYILIGLDVVALLSMGIIVLRRKSY